MIRMDIWTIPSPIVFTLMIALLYSSLTSMRIKRVAYNVAEHLANTSGSGLSKGSMGGFCTRSTPSWVRVIGWGASFAAIAMLIYVGMRFGWPWAIGYAVSDHILKSLDIPILPTVDQAYTMVESQVAKNAPHMSEQVAAYRSNYQHQ
jgi:hypothetical protein